MPTSLTQDYIDLVVETTNRMKNTPSEYYVDPKSIDRHLNSIVKDISGWANGVVNELSEKQIKQISAEQLLAKAMSSLNEADRYQFLLTNLLEGLKHGRTPSDMIDQYNQVGLTSVQIDPPLLPAQPTYGVMPDLSPSPDGQLKPATAIRRMFKCLGWICGELIKIAISAAKAISDHLKAKFKISPIVGAAAFLPSLSFQIEFMEIEGEIPGGECFDALQAVFKRFT
jgi:hypothetical protein